MSLLFVPAGGRKCGGSSFVVDDDDVSINLDQQLINLPRHHLTDVIN